MASTREWFETVEEARRRARRRLPGSVYMALVADTEQGITLRDNVAAFSELRFTPPHIADLPAARQQATSVLGQDIALPVIASPTGVQAVHPQGEVGVALGSAAAGTAMGLSSFASMPVEDVAAANPKLFFQVYWSGGKDTIADRALALGARAVMIGRAYLWGLAANGPAGVTERLRRAAGRHRLHAACARPVLDSGTVARRRHRPG